MQLEYLLLFALIYLAGSVIPGPRSSDGDVS